MVINISGIAESFRGISFTPAAQSVLKPEDIGIGIVLVLPKVRPMLEQASETAA